MIEYRNSRPSSIIGPRGERLTRDNLPPADTSRWVASRKAQVVAAVDGGMLSIDQALARYNLSLEEFYCWRQAMDRSGVAGLRVGHAQDHRSAVRRLHALPGGKIVALTTH